LTSTGLLMEGPKSLSLYIYKGGHCPEYRFGLHAARIAKGILILPAGKEADLLKDTPIEILDPSPEIYETLTTLGGYSTWVSWLPYLSWLSMSGWGRPGCTCSVLR
jgi:hypothetical protein